MTKSMMKAKVLQRSKITRYDGTFSSLSAFLLSPAPSVVDTESADGRGEGTLSLADDVFSLNYKEEESGIAVSLEREGDAVTVKRGGATLMFRMGKKTSFDYRTAYGVLPMEAYTEEVTLQEKGNIRLFTLVYTAVFGGMAQKNEMRFKITV